MAGEDIWLSPQNQGARTAISFHQYPELPWREIFPEIEKIFRHCRWDIGPKVVFLDRCASPFLAR